MRCGLLGRKLGHSYSPQIHKAFGDYEYDLFETEPHQLKAFLENTEFHGINVTIPYKKDVIPYCTELSPIAQKLGAVNTIVRRANGTLVGHNTDYFGFQSTLERTGISVNSKKVLLLGSGGAAVTVNAVLQEQGAKVVMVSRNGINNYDNISLHSDASLLVNATPVGMYPNNGESPVDLSLFPCLEGVIDLIYNPARTKLLLDAENRGLITQNGLWMLVAQAKESAQWFCGKEISNDFISQIHGKMQKHMQNIILIGMPGSGKSTVGQMLANALHKPFVDADAEIEKTAGLKIPEIFAKHGENTFRKIETEVLDRLGKQSGFIISTGGGCVTRVSNYPLLHQNSTIICLDRRIDALPTAGRPLSQKNSLMEMYIMRKPLYDSFADLVVDNNGTVEQTLATLLSREEIL